MSDLTGISGFCGSANLPGFTTLKYLPVAWLDTDEYEEIISAGNFQKGIIPSLGGAAWLTMPFVPIREDGWSQGSRRTEQGNEYAQQVSGLLRNMRPAVDAELELMERHRFLVHLTDRNGKNWLIGRQWEPLEFRCEADLASRTGGLNSYRFRFEGITTKRAFGYVPVY
jgi:hypothetical protein